MVHSSQCIWKQHGVVLFHRTFEVGDATDLEKLLVNQVFTPCGRYGLSIPSKNSFKLPVLDILLKKFTKYTYKGNGNLKCDIIYCLNSNEFISVKATPTMVKQQIWHLDHEKETFMLISTRNYRHKVKSENLSIHEQCQLDLPIKINNEMFNIWISSVPHQMNHYFVFLIPRIPNSSSKMKLFYVDLHFMPASLHKVAVYYNLNTRGSPHIVPAVLSNSLRFPVSIGEKQIFGVWTTFNFEELMDVIDLEEVDVENISQLQSNIYQLIFAPSKERNYEVKDIYPAFRSGYSRGEKHYIVWERQQRRANGPGRLFNIVDGRVHRQEAYYLSKELWTVHAIFGTVSWIQDTPPRILMCYATWHQSPIRVPPPLHATLQKSFLLKDTIDLIGFPGFENILF